SDNGTEFVNNKMAVLFTSLGGIPLSEGSGLRDEPQTKVRRSSRPKSQPVRLHAFSDADWAKCLKTRKSVSGFCIYFCNNLVSWKSKKQATISRSSVESEYRCLPSTTCEIIADNPVFHEKTKHFEIDLHLVREKVSFGVIKTLKTGSANNVADVFTKGLNVTQHAEFYLYCDSSVAIQIAANLIFYEKTKYFEIDLHLVRENVSSGVIKTLKIGSANNVADVFTKGLSVTQHAEFCKRLGLVDMFKP
ncbi:putative RNA-directed DNA polymerase, partial [Tanacetum coccineum]